MVKIVMLNINSEFELLNKKSKTIRKEQARKIVSNLTEELKKATPIDTGFARASWSVKEHDKYFDIKNTAPYIDRLNSGYSPQAKPKYIESIAIKYGTPLGTIVNKVE